MTKRSTVNQKYEYKNGNFYIEVGNIKHFFIKNRGTRYLNGPQHLGTKLALDYGIANLKLKKGDLIVDVGANVGDFSLYLQKFSGLEYVGFEPSPEEFKLLLKNLPPNYKAQNLVISNKNGMCKFYISSNGADSSLFAPKKVESTIQIESKRLDSIFYSIKLLKIDAEGAEFEVIQGAEKILKRIEYIAVDLGFEKGLNLETPCPEVVNYLMERNFKLISFTPRSCFVFANLKYRR